MSTSWSFKVNFGHLCGIQVFALAICPQVRLSFQHHDDVEGLSPRTPPTGTWQERENFKQQMTY